MMSETEMNCRERSLKDDAEYALIPEFFFNVIQTAPETITDNETCESEQVGIQKLPVEIPSSGKIPIRTYLLTGLKSLEVTKHTEIGFSAVSGNKQNNFVILKGMEDLEYLEYANMNMKFLATWLASEFCPRLKILCISPSNSSQDDLVLMLPNLARQLPELVLLSIEFRERKIPHHSWITFCSDAKKLRFLEVLARSGRISKINYKLLFKICPTLRALVHFVYPCRVKRFSREVITNKMTKNRWHVGIGLYRSRVPVWD